MTKELSSMALSELIDIYYPQNGRIIDPYSVTMITAMAALRKGRECLVIEQQGDLFFDEVCRLRSLFPGLSLPHNIINLDVKMGDCPLVTDCVNQDECDGSDSQPEYESQDEIEGESY